MKKSSLLLDIKTHKIHTKNLHDSSETGLSIDLRPQFYSLPKVKTTSEEDSTHSLLKIRSEKGSFF